jgi:hypothetical protein
LFPANRISLRASRRISSVDSLLQRRYTGVQPETLLDSLTQTDAMASSSAAAGLLARQLKQMQNDKDIPGISCGLVDNNVFEWEVMLMINDDTKFYGGA